MAANPDEPRSTPATKRDTVERVALLFGVVVLPVLAIALGIAITILANALR
jgi:hypothetical protein